MSTPIISKKKKKEKEEREYNIVVDRVVVVGSIKDDGILIPVGMAGCHTGAARGKGGLVGAQCCDVVRIME